MMKKWLTILLVGICWGWSAQAQVLTPLTEQPAPHTTNLLKRKLTADPVPLAEGDTLRLPFFDDFAKGEGAPDIVRWENQGGVYMTDRYAKQPPTVFAATFDGLRANGQVRGGSTSVGPTDTLTSKPLYLGGLQPQDSVYLSFYWQAGGLLDAPNFSSSGLYYLQLEFKEPNGTWNAIWTQKGNGRSTDFAPVMAAIKESKYLYDGFQFRWVSSGSQYGLRDVWHVDYVYLDKNRRKGQLQTVDVTLIQRLPSLLRRYTAMPIWQFQVNPSNEIRTQVGSELANLSTLPAAISWRAFTRNLTTSAVDTFLKASAPVNANARQTIAATPSADFLANQNDPYSLKTTLFLNTKEPDFFTRYNDTLRRQTDLQDYYAHDDGSAETGFSFPSSNAVNIAYQFDLNKPDRVKRVRLYFTNVNTPGTVLFLRIWGDSNGVPADPPLYEQQFAVPAAHVLNNWLDLELNQQITVQGRFYAGYRQPAGTAFVNVGFDLNENPENKIFTMNGVAVPWQAYNEVRGALLIRPVMTGTIASSVEELADSSPLIYPNPIADVFYIGQKIDRLELYSLTGQKIQTWAQLRQGQQLSLAHLPNGMYLAKVIKGTTTRTTKLILQK